MAQLAAGAVEGLLQGPFGVLLAGANPGRSVLELAKLDQRYGGPRRVEVGEQIEGEAWGFAIGIDDAYVAWAPSRVAITLKTTRESGFLGGCTSTSIRALSSPLAMGHRSAKRGSATGSACSHRAAWMHGSRTSQAQASWWRAWPWPALSVWSTGP